MIGAAWRFEQALCDSEHSSELNISLIEHPNLDPTGIGISRRRTIRHARGRECLEDHLELFRCYYNFIRPHRAPKFGLETRTPAMQAGWVSKRLRFREIFVAKPERILFMFVFVDIKAYSSGVSEQKMAAYNH